MWKGRWRGRWRGCGGTAEGGVGGGGEWRGVEGGGVAKRFQNNVEIERI